MTSYFVNDWLLWGQSPASHDRAFSDAMVAGFHGTVCVFSACIAVGLVAAARVQRRDRRRQPVTDA